MIPLFLSLSVVFRGLPPFSVCAGPISACMVLWVGRKALNSEVYFRYYPSISAAFRWLPLFSVTFRGFPWKSAIFREQRKFLLWVYWHARDRARVMPHSTWRFSP